MQLVIIRWRQRGDTEKRQGDKVKKHLLISGIFLWLVTGTANALTSIDLIKTTKSWEGSALPSVHLKQPQVTIKEITIDPGEVLPVHKHDVINAGILLEGELTVYTENETASKKLLASPNDNKSIVETFNQWHYGINTGNVPAKIVVFYFSEENAVVTELKADEQS